MILRATIIATGCALLATAGDAVDRVQEANQVFQEIMKAPDQAIPEDLLSKAHCIAIVPGVKRAAFILGAQYGKGVVLCRQASGKGWTGPSTVRVEGGSVGFQIGGSETDLIMLVMNENGAQELMKSEFTLGGDASVAAGPVGRSAEANTDAYMQAKVLAYSRSRGAFAGVALKGATLRSDDSDNTEIYGKAVSHEQILMGKVAAPASAKDLRATLNRYSSSEAD